MLGEALPRCGCGSRKFVGIAAPVSNQLAFSGRNAYSGLVALPMGRRSIVCCYSFPQMNLRRSVLHILVLLPLAVSARGGDAQRPPDDVRDEYPRAVGHEDSALQHLIEVAPGLYSGSDPRGSEAFAELNALGVETVVSVDGARPDIETATEFGIRYIHVPFGYDGIPAEAAAALTRVMRETEGPVYVHCHHGRHRGPAAAAICGLANGSLDQPAASRLLQLAETSPDYEGLWRDVAIFERLPEDIELPELREVTEVESMTTAMARISRNVDRLKALEERGWQGSPTDAGVVPHRVALLISEDLTECARHLTGEYEAEIRTLMEASAVAASRLTAALRDEDRQQASENLSLLGRSCSRCHVSYRN